MHFLKIVLAGVGVGCEPGISWFSFIFSLNRSAIDHLATAPPTPMVVQLLTWARHAQWQRTNFVYPARLKGIPDLTLNAPFLSFDIKARMAPFFLPQEYLWAKENRNIWPKDIIVESSKARSECSRLSFWGISSFLCPTDEQGQLLSKLHCGPPGDDRPCDGPAC